MRVLFFGILAAMSLAISGCTDELNQLAATSGASTGKTPQEIALEKETRSLTQVSRSIVVRNTVEGALVGAALGCIAADLTGGKCADGALAGGILGGIGGNAVGQKAAKVNKELVNQRAVIDNLNGINKKLGSVQSNLRRVVSAQNTEISSLKRQLANEQISKSQYSSRVRAINSNRKSVSSNLLRTEQNVAKSRKTLVSLEQQGGKSLTQSKRAAASVQSRVANMRKTVSLVQTN